MPTSAHLDARRSKLLLQLGGTLVVSQLPHAAWLSSYTSLAQVLLGVVVGFSAAWFGEVMVRDWTSGGSRHV